MNEDRYIDAYKLIDRIQSIYGKQCACGKETLTKVLGFIHDMIGCEKK